MSSKGNKSNFKPQKPLHTGTKKKFLNNQKTNGKVTEVQYV